MRAVRYHRPKNVSVDTVPDPRIEQPTDAIVRVTATAICGSDLHIYNGLILQLRRFVLGHEFMGIVEDVGSSVQKLRRGDRVVVPFPIACGACFFCERSLPVHCEVSNPGRYGPEGGLIRQKGGGLFGYTDLYGGYDGGQAEAVRVPFADFGPRQVPDSLSDEQALFLTDIIPTGFAAIDWADLQGGETVAVFGCGPVGLMAMKCAWLRGAGRVIGVDLEPYRLSMAERVADADVIDARETDPVEIIRAETGGRGADVVVDAVGMEAHRGLMKKLANVVHVQLGSTAALEKCLSAVRRGGVVSIVGVYGMSYDNFPLGQLFDKGVSLRMGQAPVHRYADHLVDLVASGKLRADDIITHRMPLAEAPRAYQLFNRKEDGCVKVVLHP
jgi:S-(hydroxymethyl)glutathione dehydrogenase / alcohol dehydrogenase